MRSFRVARSAMWSGDADGVWWWTGGWDWAQVECCVVVGDRTCDALIDLF